jgi:amidase
MTETELWRLSACDLAHLVAGREVSAAEAVEAAVARMQAANGAINAVTDDLSTEARAAADALDRAMAASGPVGPLHGVPVTIKENTDQEGRPTPNGVAAYQDVVAPADSPFVANLRAAGAVVIGRTSTPEFSFRLDTDSPRNGPTRNPLGAHVSAGGSSGGAAAAVMAGMGALAHGTDIAGSLRVPSACTGAATVKPGLGRTPAWNPSQPAERGMLAQVMAVQGVIAREIRDVRLAMRAAVAYRPEDPWQVRAPWEGPAEQAPLRVGVTRETWGHVPHPAVARALDEAEAALRGAGHLVEPVTVPDIAATGFEAMRALLGEMKVMMLPAIRAHGSEPFNAHIDRLMAWAPPYEGDALLDALGRRAAVTRTWLGLLERTPLILTPFLLDPPHAPGREYAEDGAEAVWGRAFHAVAMNWMGLPAGVVAADVHEGLPIAVQVVGRRLREDLVLDACEAIERRVGAMVGRLGTFDLAFAAGRA